MVRLASLIVATLLLAPPAVASPAVTSQTAIVISIDPHSDIAGDWYDTRRKVKVTITGNVATITEISSSRPFPAAYVLGARVGVLRPGEFRAERREYRYTGECIDPTGTDNRMMENCTSQFLTAYSYDGRRVHYELDLWLLKLKRRADFSQSEWDARQ